MDIDTLLAEPRTNVDVLRHLDAELLAEYVIDTANPWWRRRTCAAALAGRVPRSRVPRLLERVRDPTDTGEVRRALLELLADQEELQPWLRHPDRAAETSYHLPQAILKARGVAGDRSALPQLASLAHDDWPHLRAMGADGVDALVARYGLEPILADLDADRPQDRACAARLRYHAGDDVTHALADPDAGVAALAARLVDDVDRLRDYLNEAPSLDAKLWAAWALHELTEDETQTREIYRTLGQPRIEVDGLDEEIRAAIVREWVPRCQPRTDPRWRLEAVCAQYPPAPDPDDQIRRATAALAQAGLVPQPAAWVGDDSPGGYGTYHVIEHDGGNVRLCTLGRFVTSHSPHPAARGALKTAGFRWIEGELADINVTGLHTYFFGDRGTRDVDTLLFYWTD